MAARPSSTEIFLVALKLGCTSFGGPVAHLAFFRDEYVIRRRWLDEAHYADLVALCQFLPGPASSQVGFGVGYLHRGLAGGLAAWLGFTLPSALLMTGFAWGLTALGDLSGAGWLRGLKAAAVAVVAQAVWAMARGLCPDWPRRALGLAAAALVLWLPSAWSQVAALAIGAAVGSLLPGARPAPPAVPATESGGWARGAPWLVAFAVLLAGLPVLAQATGNPWVEVGDRFYRVGALVFGGGHVVLPLLEREVVAPGWLTHDQFLAGYGAAQALPGPLFAFSAYLGAVTTHLPPTSAGPWPGAAWALVMVFLPALLLVAGVLPVWQSLRRHAAAQAAMRGANAAVVGVLLAAFIHPVCTAGITDLRTAALAAAGFAGLASGRLPPWAWVAAAAAIGALAL